jgi:hypothetical protein
MTRHPSHQHFAAGGDVIASRRVSWSIGSVKAVARHYSTFDGAVHWYDDLLEPPQFTEIVKFANGVSFNEADEQNQELIWAQNNRASPSIAQSIVWPEYSVHRRMIAGVPGISIYPSGSPLDAALQVIRELSLETGISGKIGTDWIGIISTVFKYDRNAGLIFHTDSTGYSGAFTYYLNSQWKSDWGGHLLFTQNDPKDVNRGEFLSPQPNRLVLMRSGVPHSISTVATPEGISRMALSGFFVRPERAAELIKRYLLK